MIKDAHELKQLQSRKAKLEVDVQQYQQDKDNAVDILQTAKGTLKGIERQIKKLKEKNKDLVVSEHAVLRYFERVLGYDIASIQEQMASRLALSKLGGDGKYPVLEEYRAVIKNNVVVTIE